jgi:crotonobetainyl-CoA:carnitine CoA-transferase CaiB-like acyl-CoA transferase
MLADLGADVIKIEPHGGAFERSWSAPDAYLDEASVFFLLANRNVRSMAVDLKSNEVPELLHDLIQSADVLIESFRPGAMDRLGLGYETVRQLNPRLVYCSLSGYGSTGPYRDRPGQDVLIQALSGLAAATGRGEEPPTPAGASLVDQHGATLGALGIRAALFSRERTGRGMLVESNLLNAALDLQIEPLGYFLNGFPAQRSRSGISSAYYKAPYGVFETADRHVCLSLNSLATLRATFDDPWFDSVSESESHARREEVNERIAKHLRGRTYEEWCEVFAREKVWYAPVNDYADVATDPQVRHNGSVISYEDPDLGEVNLLGHPVTYDGNRPGLRTSPPRLGAHTREVLESLGYHDARIQQLFEAGAVSSHE